jgi:hypothetical protein
MSFRVVTDRIEQLAVDLDALASNLDDVAQRRVAYEGYADVACVDDGLGELLRCGTDGMRRLHGQVAGLASHLHDAASAYDAAEQGIVDAVHGSS